MYYQHRLIFKQKTEITEYGLLKLVVNILLDLFWISFFETFICLFSWQKYIIIKKEKKKEVLKNCL